MQNLLLAEKGFPQDILQDIRKIESTLRRHGAAKIILYGSLARGDYRADSDIDICVAGLPAKEFFRALAECLMNTQRRMSILDLHDVRGYLRERIMEEGKVLYERE